MMKTKHHTSFEGDLLEKLMQAGPVFYAARYEGRLQFREIYSISRTDFYSEHAPMGLAGRPYVSINFKADGYYAFHPNPERRGIGAGYGNGCSSFLDEDDNAAGPVFFTKAKIFTDKPPFPVIYTWEPLGKDIEEHNERMKREAR